MPKNREKASKAKTQAENFADIEAYARDAAARGESQSSAAATLGINRAKFRLICAAFEKPIDWPSPGQSAAQQRASEDRRGVAFPKAVAALQRGSERIKANSQRTIDGRTGSIEYLSKFYGVSARTVYRRLAAGKTLEEALKGGGVGMIKEQEIDP